MIGEEERKIRQDPVGSGSAILQKVFGALAETGRSRLWLNIAHPMSSLRAGSGLLQRWLSRACTPTFNWRETPVGDDGMIALLPCKPDRATRALPLGAASGVDRHGRLRGGRRHLRGRPCACRRSPARQRRG